MMVQTWSALPAAVGLALACAVSGNAGPHTDGNPAKLVARSIAFVIRKHGGRLDPARPLVVSAVREHGKSVVRLGHPAKPGRAFAENGQVGWIVREGVSDTAVAAAARQPRGRGYRAKVARAMVAAYLYLWRRGQIGPAFQARLEGSPPKSKVYDITFAQEPAVVGGFMYVSVSRRMKVVTVVPGV